MSLIVAQVFATSAKSPLLVVGVVPPTRKLPCPLPGGPSTQGEVDSTSQKKSTKNAETPACPPPARVPVNGAAVRLTVEIVSTTAASSSRRTVLRCILFFLR